MANGDTYEHDDWSALQRAGCLNILVFSQFHFIKLYVRLLNRRCYVPKCRAHNFWKRMWTDLFSVIRIFLFHTLCVDCETPRVYRVRYKHWSSHCRRSATMPQPQSFICRIPSIFESTKRAKTNHKRLDGECEMRWLVLPSGCLFGCRAEKFICFACGRPATRAEYGAPASRRWNKNYE